MNEEINRGIKRAFGDKKPSRWFKDEIIDEKKEVSHASKRDLRVCAENKVDWRYIGVFSKGKLDSNVINTIINLILPFIDYYRWKNEEFNASKGILTECKESIDAWKY